MPAFLVDENLPERFIDMASEHGWSAVWVRDVMPGAEDRQMLQRSRTTGEVLVTRDVRFANLVLSLMALEETLPGVVLIREQRMRHMQTAWRRYLVQDPILENALVVAEQHELRVRRRM